MTIISARDENLHSAFPENFVWGVATSAYQIEGAAFEEGKGPSIWDDFCRLPNAIADNSNGDVACDHYHRLESDLDIIASLGVEAYRFSTAWPRVRPEGTGAWNEKGVDFYERLVDGLLQRNIKPYLTLNHWDLPSALQAQGGWENRSTVDYFVEYACYMEKLFGDRVVSFTTHNEPWVIAMLGHDSGIFAPGIKSRASAMQVSHHLLLSHGLATQAMRAQGCKSKIGIVLNLSPVVPATDSVEDIKKAQLEDGKLTRWYTDPLFKQSYPEDVLEHLGADAPKILTDDMRNIGTPIDFLGVNYYTRSVVSATGPWDCKKHGGQVTDMDWEIYPSGLTDLLVRLDHDYDLPPMYVTENGAAFKDAPPVNGHVHDIQRVEFISQHIAAIGEAIRKGVRMEGYMVWSLMDNFEWSSGYEKRFGIIHVDYKTQVRTLKNSALWYREFLQFENSEKHQTEVV